MGRGEGFIVGSAAGKTIRGGIRESASRGQEEDDMEAVA